MDKADGLLEKVRERIRKFTWFDLCKERADEERVEIPRRDYSG
jgi:hypothetical protein